MLRIAKAGRTSILLQFACCLGSCGDDAVGPPPAFTQNEARAVGYLIGSVLPELRGVGVWNAGRPLAFVHVNTVRDCIDGGNAAIQGTHEQRSNRDDYRVVVSFDRCKRGEIAVSGDLDIRVLSEPDYFGSLIRATMVGQVDVINQTQTRPCPIDQTSARYGGFAEPFAVQGRICGRETD